MIISAMSTQRMARSYYVKETDLVLICTKAKQNLLNTKLFYCFLLYICIQKTKNYYRFFTMNKIAIIGGSYLQLPVVRKAKDLGLEVHCFSWREGTVCDKEADYYYPISIIKKEEILKVCQDIGINGILTIASDVAVPTVNYVATEMGLIGNSSKYSAMMTNKYQMRTSFSEHGIPSPSYKLVKSRDNIYEDSLKWPLIVKPTDRSGSLGVEKVYDISHLYSAIDEAVSDSFNKEAIVEEYVDGLEISIESISWNGRHYVLQITDKVTTGEPYFVETEHHQPSCLPDNIQKRIRELVPKALDALHIKYGASHSEMKITPSGELVFIEIGARMGGDFIGSTLVQLSTGYDYLKGVIDVALGHFEEPIITKHACSGVYFLSEETSFLRKYMDSPELIGEVVTAEYTDHELRKIKSSGDRSGYLIYNADKRIILK